MGLAERQVARRLAKGLNLHFKEPGNPATPAAVRTLAKAFQAAVLPRAPSDLADYQPRLFRERLISFCLLHQTPSAHLLGLWRRRLEKLRYIRATGQGKPMAAETMDRFFTKFPAEKLAACTGRLLAVRAAHFSEWDPVIAEISRRANKLQVFLNRMCAQLAKGWPAYKWRDSIQGYLLEGLTEVLNNALNPHDGYCFETPLPAWLRQFVHHRLLSEYKQGTRQQEILHSRAAEVSERLGYDQQEEGMPKVLQAGLWDKGLLRDAFEIAETSFSGMVSQFVAKLLFNDWIRGENASAKEIAAKIKSAYPRESCEAATVDTVKRRLIQKLMAVLIGYWHGTPGKRKSDLNLLEILALIKDQTGEILANQKTGLMHLAAIGYVSGLGRLGNMLGGKYFHMLICQRRDLSPHAAEERAWESLGNRIIDLPAEQLGMLEAMRCCGRWIADQPVFQGPRKGRDAHLLCSLPHLLVQRKTSILGYLEMFSPDLIRMEPVLDAWFAHECVPQPAKQGDKV